MEKKAQIQELISLGKTEEALELLEQLTTDAVLLQSRFNGAKRQYSMGMIDFSEWSRTQAQINYAALEMMNSVKSGKKQEQEGQLEPKKAESISPSVFISYNQMDTFEMRAVKGELEQNGIKVFADIFEMEAGENIQTFIDKAMKGNMFVLSLISQNSLKSGWVNIELSGAMMLDKFKKKWLPARLDDACFDDDFYFNTLDSFDERIKGVQAKVQKAMDRNVDYRPFEDELLRAEDMKANFGRVVKTLKSVLVVDISEKMFELGMNRIIKTIKSNL